jgi:hypothetical protein
VLAVADDRERACTRSDRVTIDVTTEIMIHRPRAEVAAYAADPDHAPDWYVNIHSVEWKTPPPLAIGSEIAFVARFMGRTHAYSYVVVELAPAERIVMRSVGAPFPMETTYTWTDIGEVAAIMSLRSRGEPSGIAKVRTRLVAPAMRRANRDDLRRLKAILEGEPARAMPPGRNARRRAPSIAPPRTER